MMPRTPGEMLADVASALVHEHDISDLLVRLVRDAADLAGGGAAGLLVLAPDVARLEMLAATDHVTKHLEIYQAQQQEGPCVDVCTTGLPVIATQQSEILARWPVTGRAILDAGFRQVHAYPVAWRGKVLGGLNIFGRDEGGPDNESARMARAFADMVTLVLTIAVARPGVRVWVPREMLSTAGDDHTRCGNAGHPVTPGGHRMATDYDAPRKTDEDVQQNSIQELQAHRSDKASGAVDQDETEAAEGFELPGADLSGEELTIRVLPRQADEFNCPSCFLVHHRSQLAHGKTGQTICMECAA